MAKRVREKGMKNNKKQFRPLFDKAWTKQDLQDFRTFQTVVSQRNQWALIGNRKKVRKNMKQISFLYQKCVVALVP